MKRLILIPLCIWFLLISYLLVLRLNDRRPEVSDTSFEDQAIATFEELWSMPGSIDFLQVNETWDNSPFSLKVVGNSEKITLTFRSDLYSVEELFAQSDISIHSAYSVSEEYFYLFDTESFYMTALLDGIDQKAATASFSLYDSPESVVFVVVIDGHIYKSEFSL